MVAVCPLVQVCEMVQVCPLVQVCTPVQVRAIVRRALCRCRCGCRCDESACNLSRSLLHSHCRLSQGYSHQGAGGASPCVLHWQLPSDWCCGRFSVLVGPRSLSGEKMLQILCRFNLCCLPYYWSVLTMLFVPWILGLPRYRICKYFLLSCMLSFLIMSFDAKEC